MTELKRKDIQPLIDRTCGACHGGGNALGGLRLDNDVIFDNLVNTPSSVDGNLTLVVPGDVANSYFVQKLQANPTNGVQMPMGGAAWSPDEIRTLTDWIAADAPRGDFNSSTHSPAGR